jgi:hypothetical protein
MEEVPISVPVAEELMHVVTDVEVFDVLGKAFPCDGAIAKSEFNLFHRTVVYPVEEKVKGRRVKVLSSMWYILYTTKCYSSLT